jgi:hypothetical protein
MPSKIQLVNRKRWVLQGPLSLDPDLVFIRCMNDATLTGDSPTEDNCFFRYCTRHGLYNSAA